MKPWKLIEQTRTPDGGDMRLMVHDDEFVIQVDGQTLMSSRAHGSEEAMAPAAGRHSAAAWHPRVLVGGLGMGFTLRATLDRLPNDASLTVAELVPAVIDWNCGPLGPLANHPLSDGRVEVEVCDVGELLRSASNRFDAIILDVDNGPTALAAEANHGLYDDSGVAAAHAALKPGGVLVVWSAGPDRAFERRLRRLGFIVTVDRVRARLKKGGARHVIFTAMKQARAHY